MPGSQGSVEHLVVVGASAGGVEALGVLLASLPADLPAAVVVAQHLDATRPSLLPEVLARKSVLPIVTVEQSETLKPGVVYVVPSNRHIEISDHHVAVHADGAHRPTPSINLLFATAAATFTENLVAVVLSGSGSDGAIGAHAVKEFGGAVIVQDPETAAFPSMPRSLEAPLIDAVAPLDRLGALVASFVSHGGRDDGLADGLAPLLDRLRDRRGVDFSTYKKPTIERRLRRRMIAANVASLADYLSLLDAQPDEEQRLVADFLIKVTRFFRDPALFDKLRHEILPQLIAAAKAENRELRLWSAGCATGEEAYSLALIVADAIDAGAGPVDVRIFATDLDEAALAYARRGVFPASELDDVPEAIVKRHFTPVEDAFEVSKQLRAMVVFGSHDLGRRPPFPNTDLILCRNVLIYFMPELQRRALEIFAYSLRDDGYLVLGKSETARPFEQSFAVVDRRLRIFRRHGPRNLLLPERVPTMVQNPPGKAPASRTRADYEFALHQAAAMSAEIRAANGRAEQIIRHLPVGVAAVNKNYDIEIINGPARELLGIHGSAIGHDLVHLAERVPSPELRRALDRMLRGDSSSPGAVLPAETASGEARSVAVDGFPERVGERGEIESIVLVLTDVTDVVSAQREREADERRARTETEHLRAVGDRTEAANRRLLAQNRELADLVDELRAQVDDLRLATVASQVAAEEIETLNEELQSTNEELETLHEESQATVEELNVANEELQSRTAELEVVAAVREHEQARLAAILSGMADAVLVVDRSGRRVRANDAYEAMIASLASPFAPQDQEGGSLPWIEGPVQRVARGESFRLDFTATALDGNQRWFESTGTQLHAEEGGGILVIRDITDRSILHMQEEFLSWAGHELRTPLTALQSYLQMAIRKLEPTSDERIKSYLASAIEQARRQAALIDELLDATRLRSGRFEFAFSPVDLREVVEHAAETARALAAGQAIHLTVDEAPMIVSGNSGRLEQVFLNLLSNAITYAAGTERIDVTVTRRDGNAEVAVRDYGPGIPPAALGTVFDRFSRADRSVRVEGGGLGLGLFIVREITRAHGGSVFVSSVEGEGATFTVLLPLLIDGALSGGERGAS